jgi:DNA-binding transcriptional regulator YiaG
MTGKPGVPRSKRGAPLDERLRLHLVEAPSGCWIWLGAKTGEYGRITVNGKCLWAHRVSYETFVGPIPAGLEIDHLCRRPGCINPRHLQAVTPSVNVLRGTSPGARARRRDKCVSGHAYAEFGVMRSGRRICRACRAEARAAYANKPRDLALAAELRAARLIAGMSQADAARLFGCSQSRLCQMELGRTDITRAAESRLRLLYAPQLREAS